MKIINILKGSKPGVSCELFPPKQGSQLANALEIVDTIAEQKPSFISVTYGAGGSNAGEAVAVAAEVHKCGIPSMAHFTCINADDQGSMPAIWQRKSNLLGIFVWGAPATRKVIRKAPVSMMILKN